jgi:hypothetical protein
VDVRIVLGCAAVFALGAGIVAAAGEQNYRARAFVIQVSPELGGRRGLEFARSQPVLRRALELAGERTHGVGWLAGHSSVELTSRLDLAFTVEAPERGRAAALATGYARAFRASIPDEPGLATRGRGARDAQPELGPLGWALLGGAGGLWVGAALAILYEGLVSRGSARALRRASPACAPARRPTRG